MLEIIKERSKLLLENLKENLDGRTYLDLKCEWEEQNKIIDNLTSSLQRLDKRYRDLTKFSYCQLELYANVRSENKKLKAQLRELQYKNKKYLRKRKINRERNYDDNKEN